MTHFAFEIPTLDAGDVTLRAVRESDLDAIAAFYATERSHFVGGPLDRIASWRVISASLGHWALRGYGYWQIEDKASGQTAGACGFIFREGWEEPELGWQVWDGFEGRGIAYQAVQAARAYGARNLGLDGVISYIRPDNARSRRLGERLGAALEKETDFLGQPCLVYRHPKQEERA